MKRDARVGHPRTGREVTIRQVAEASAAERAAWKQEGFFDERTGRQMYAITKVPAPSRRFAFMPSDKAAGPGSDGETWTHLYAKEAVIERGLLRVRLNGLPVVLEFSGVRDEVEWTTPGGTAYCFDLVCRIRGPEHVTRSWGRQLIVEVCVYNPTDDQKIADIQARDVTAIEIKVEQDIARSESSDMSDTDRAVIRRRVFGWLNYPREVTILHVRTAKPYLAPEPQRTLEPESPTAPRPSVLAPSPTEHKPVASPPKPPTPLTKVEPSRPRTPTQRLSLWRRFVRWLLG